MCLPAPAYVSCVHRWAFRHKGASGHTFIPRAIGETAGARDHIARLPGNGGHHSNTASLEGAEALALPTGRQGSGK